MILSKSILSGIAAAAIIALPVIAEANCGTGPITYNDVSAIMLTSAYRPSDRGDDATRRVTHIADSTFWMLIWEDHGYEIESHYSQYNLIGAVGSYNIHSKLAEVKKILRRNDFYRLNPADEPTLTDTPQTVLSVLRCSVVTRIIMYNDPDAQDQAAAKLFSDLREFIVTSKKAKTSNRPSDFTATLLFDP